MKTTFINWLTEEAVKTIKTNIEDMLTDGTLQTYEAIIQCCVDQGENEILYSQLVPYLPYKPVGDYPWVHLSDLEENMCLISTGKAMEWDEEKKHHVESDDTVIFFRGIDLTEWAFEFGTKPDLTLIQGGFQ
jgi:hypothetical protein